MTRFFILSLLIFLSFPATAQMEDTLLLNTGTGVIEGSLLMPADQPCPVALIIAGSGPTDRDGNNAMMKNNSLKYLAEGLAHYGIASLRYDKRGIARSKESSSGEINMRIETFADDAADWIDVLAQDDRFSSITIIGHSIGSLQGMLAARQSATDGFVSLAGAGRPAGQTLREQLSQQSEIIMKFALPILESLESGETVDTVDPMLMALFRPSVQPYLISWLAYDPAVELDKLQIPVMIAQGSNDIQVSVEDAIALSSVKPDAKLYIVKGMNHVLKESSSERTSNISTYYDPDLPVMPELIRSIASFIGSVDSQD